MQFGLMKSRIWCPLAHDHFLRGKARLVLKFTVGYAVMLARACVAVKAGQPEKMRSWASSLAA